jgi:apoptosis-inducing factor 3
MGGGETKLRGPDLTKGIASGDVADGMSLLGHVEGEAVLVARRGRDVFAIGATCTHYGGPLAEGLVVGETVRCPWHHACFSLRSGEPVRAPALNPVACYRVEERGGRLLVLGKKEGAPTRPAHSPAKPPDGIVVVGAGAAGNAAAEMIRRLGYMGKLTMVGADPSGPCDRPNLSKDYLAGNAPEEWIPLRPPDFYEDQRIELVLGTRVTKLDLPGKAVVLEGGRRLGYGALLLATGATPVRPPIPGADASNVHYLRTLADSRAIIARSSGAKRAVVVGASFIGLEVAASLRARKLEVAVVAPERIPLARVMGDEIGRAVRQLHEERGVVFHLGETVARIEPGKVTLSSGRSLEADFVVIGAGVVPDMELAASAGLATDKGVLVDEHLETSEKGVFAAGDIARWPDARSGEKIRVEHWVVAETQGQVAAENMLGNAVRYAAVPFFWSAHYDVTISYVGHASSWDRVDIAGDVNAGDCAVALRKAGKTLAVATIGRDHACLEAEAAMERNDEQTLARLVPPKS